MKKVIKIVLVLIFSFGFISYVNASEFRTGELYDFYTESPIYRVTDNFYGLTLDDGYLTYEELQEYYIGTGDKLFCLDAGVSDAGQKKVYVQSLLNPSSRARDYALSGILKHYDDAPASEKHREYAAVLIALRIFDNAVLKSYPQSIVTLQGEPAVQYQQNNFRYISTFADWYSNNGNYRVEYTPISNIPPNIYAINRLYMFPKLYDNQTLKSLAGGDYLPVIDHVREVNSGITDDEILKKAKRYVLKAMVDYNDFSTMKFTNPKVRLTGENTFHVYGDVESSAYAVARMDMSGFSSGGSVRIINAVAKGTVKGNLVGYSLSPIASVDDATRLSLNKLEDFNILGLGAKTVYLLFELKYNNDDNAGSTCKPSEFVIEYEYSDSTVVSGALFTVNAYGTAPGAFQRFVAFSSKLFGKNTMDVKLCNDQCKPVNSLPENCSNASVIDEDANEVIASFQEGYDEKGNLNIGRCIIDNSDILNNPYQVAESVDNPYCNLYCKEDVEIHSPYKIDAYAGRTLKDFYVTIKGTQSCYTSKINYNASGTPEQLAQCQNAAYNYDLNPDIIYEYDEKDDNGKKRTGSMEINEKYSEETTTILGCKDSKYNDCSESYSNSNYVMSKTEKTIRLEPVKEYYINHSQLGLIVKKDKINSSNEEYYSLVDGLPINIDTLAGTYNYSLVINKIGTFYANATTNNKGRIYDTNNKLSLSNYTKEKEDNNGESNGNSYACTYTVDERSYCLDENDEIKTPSDCLDNEDWDSCQKRLCPEPSTKKRCIQEKDNYYLCSTDHYSDNPSDCTLYGPSQSDRARALAVKDVVNVSCCPQCEVIVVKPCDSCIVSGNELQVDYRTITPNKVNPNKNRNAGYNWYYNEPEPDTSDPVQVKAYYTISEVEKAEEKKYNETIKGGVVTSDYSLKVKMTPNMASDIRKYNQTQKEEGSYTNSTIKCDDYIEQSITSEAICSSIEGYTWENNKCVIKDILCYSEFIDNLISDYPNDVEAPNRRSTTSYVTYSIDGINNQKNIKTNGYWTIFPDYALEDVGPSWK